MYCVLDACFSLRAQQYGLAARWLVWELQKYGVRLSSPDTAQILLVTCVDPRNWKFLRSVRKKYPTAVIVAGGAGALAPYSLGLYADMVCVGDGRNVVHTLCTQGVLAAGKLPEVWINGESREVQVAPGFPWDCPPIQAEDGAYRVWCGRGCKHSCAYCQTSWSTSYEENPNTKILLSQIGQLQKEKKKFAYLSNDPMQHRFFAQLPSVGHGSFSIEYIRRNGLPPARQLRLGIEGVSARLRKMVGKPLSKQDLEKSAVWMCSHGKSIRWFLIAGIPGEDADDWEELKDVLSYWKRNTVTGVLALSFTAWQPEPATPMGILPLDDSYIDRYNEFSEWFFTQGWSNRIKLMRPAGIVARMNSAKARMGLEEKQLYSGGNWGPNDRVAYPKKAARNRWGMQLYAQVVGGNGPQ